MDWPAERADQAVEAARAVVAAPSADCHDDAVVVLNRRTLGTLSGVIVALGVLGCEAGKKPAPSLDTLRQPSGIAMADDGRWLFATNGNFDQRDSNGVLLTIDLAAFHDATRGGVGEIGASLSAAQPCRLVEAGLPTVECREASFIDASASVLLGDAVGNIVIDRPSGDEGALRLLVSQRLPAGVAWLDVLSGDEGVEVECGQNDEGQCDDEHLIRRSPSGSVGIGGEPSRVVLDDQGFRFAYVPHLVDGSISLIDLDGDVGPELSARAEEFYREDPFEGLEVRGGFSVASRACDPNAAPAATRECSRPMLYTTHRFWPGLREFTVAPGLEVILSGADRAVAPIGTAGNVDAPSVDGERLEVAARPIMGDLQFEDSETGESLLVVQTTPGALVRFDVASDEEGEPRNQVLDAVGLCSNPNILEVYSDELGDDLALVTCFSDARLAAVSLRTFSVVASIAVGEGANEIVVDEGRKFAYVANSREDTISVVDLDRSRPTFLTETARIGTGAGPRL